MPDNFWLVIAVASFGGLGLGLGLVLGTAIVRALRQNARPGRRAAD